MKTKLNPTKSNLPGETRRKVIDLLNQNLADILDLQLGNRQQPMAAETIQGFVEKDGRRMAVTGDDGWCRHNQ